MGNSIGVECTFNDIYVTNILIQEKEKLWKKIDEATNRKDELIGNSEEQIKNRSGDISRLCVNTHINVKNCKGDKGRETVGTTTTTTTSATNITNSINNNNSSSNNNNITDVEKQKEVSALFYNNLKAENGSEFETIYSEMQNLFFEYLATIHPIIDDSLFLYTIKDGKETFVDREISLNNVSKICKENSQTGEVRWFVQMLWQMYSDIGKEEKNKEKISENESESKSKNQKNINEEGKVLLLYCWSFRRKVLEELLIKSKKFMKDLFLNVTGINMNYIRKKINKLKKLNVFSNVFHICYHQEMQCTNSCMNFLKRFSPDSFFRFISINENKKNVETTEPNKLSVYTTKCVCLSKYDMQNFLSTQIVNLKSIVSYYAINKNREIMELGNSIIGTSTICALWLLLTGQKKSFEHILQLAENGKNNRFDMTVGDIYGSNYNLIGLSKDVIASLFGKAQHMDYIKTCFNTLKDTNSSTMLLGFESEEENETSDDGSNYKINSDSSKCADRLKNSKKDQFCSFPSVISKFEKRKKWFNYHSDTLCTYANKDTTTNAKDCPVKMDAKIKVKRGTEMKMKTEMEIEKEKKKMCDESKRDKSKKEKGIEFSNPTDIQLDEVQCDLATSLLSLLAISIFQQAYVNCNIHNIKSIVVIGCFSNNTNFQLTIQQLINFWSKKTIRLYFVKPSKHVTSLGAALHSLH